MSPFQFSALISLWATLDLRPGWQRRVGTGFIVPTIPGPHSSQFGGHDEACAHPTLTTMGGRNDDQGPVLEQPPARACRAAPPTGPAAHLPPRRAKPACRAWPKVIDSKLGPYAPKRQSKVYRPLADFIDATGRGPDRSSGVQDPGDRDCHPGPVRHHSVIQVLLEYCYPSRLAHKAPKGERLPLSGK